MSAFAAEWVYYFSECFMMSGLHAIANDPNARRCDDGFRDINKRNKRNGWVANVSRPGMRMPEPSVSYLLDDRVCIISPDKAV